MQLRKLYYLLLILPLLFLSPACSDDDNSTEPEPQVNEAEVLAKYLDEGVGVGNIPGMITATEVYNKVISQATDQFIIDIRSTDDYNAGHIAGAVNITLNDIVSYYETNHLESYTTVVITCYTGQTAGFATAMLRMLGYTNVKDMKWGMCSWNSSLADRWENAVGNTYASQFVTTDVPKNAAGDLPEINTGEENGADILRARVVAVLSNATCFSDAAATAGTVFGNLAGYYIVNYWPVDHYNLGHIPGAVQYNNSPSELTYSTSLNTLPTDKPVVVYCYTGQTSAHMAAYLTVLGYDAKTLLYGVNTMNYEMLPTAKYDAATQTFDYPLVQ